MYNRGTDAVGKNVTNQSRGFLRRLISIVLSHQSCFSLIPNEFVEKVIFESYSSQRRQYLHPEGEYG